MRPRSARLRRIRRRFAVPGPFGWRATRAAREVGLPRRFDLRLGDRRFELLPGHGAGEVEERAGRRGHRDPAVDGRLVGRERDPPSIDRGPIDAPRRDDVRRGAACLADPPERRPGVVAQYGAWSGREDGCHPSARAAHDRVADGEHTAMERVKAARGEAMIDRVIAQTHGTELPPGNDACWRAASRATATSVADSPPISR